MTREERLPKFAVAFLRGGVVCPLVVAHHSAHEAELLVIEKCNLTREERKTLRSYGDCLVAPETP